MDIVYIRDLRVEAIIGIFEWEREVRQVISLDLDLAADIRPAANSDDIKDALAKAKEKISQVLELSHG